MTIIGRKKEMDELRDCVHSYRSHFVAIYGRRRVGKTFLVRSYFNNTFAFYATGLANANKTTQLNSFNNALNKSSSLKLERAEDWLSAFNNLIKVLEQNHQQKKIVFLDELPWLDTRNSGFITGLEFFWNSWASARNDIILIVCGSASWWIIEKIINNKKGLYNRVTKRLKIDPFTLKETKEFLEAKGGNYDNYQVIEFYMAFGGIPFYLENIAVKDSAAMNIDRMCFGKNAMMRDEYSQLFSSLFNHPERHIAVIQALTKQKNGLQRGEILKYSGLTDGGSFTNLLDELEACNFIRKYTQMGNKNRESVYQLMDNYTLFYHKFLDKAHVADENVWLNMVNSPTYYAWAGNAFEMICLQHTHEIKKELGIAGILTQTYAWSNKTSQIDMVIDRKDNVINLVEAKFSINEFTITKGYSDNLRNKIGSFRDETKTKKAVWLVMISTYGLAQSPYNGLIQSSLTIDMFF